MPRRAIALVGTLRLPHPLASLSGQIAPASDNRKMQALFCCTLRAAALASLVATVAHSARTRWSPPREETMPPLNFDDRRALRFTAHAALEPDTEMTRAITPDKLSS